uniref:Cyclic nucleotide-binding domain-containing protein n=1 Tax=Macrostomum lignano TaxID=282301 RepID=A0A1I8IYD6_9PLAT
MPIVLFNNIEGSLPSSLITLVKIALTHLGHLGQLALANVRGFIFRRTLDAGRDTNDEAEKPRAAGAAPRQSLWCRVASAFTRQLVRLYWPLEEASESLRMLQEAGMQKVNFSGGEPFLEQRGRLPWRDGPLLQGDSRPAKRQHRQPTAASSREWRVAGHPSRVLRTASTRPPTGPSDATRPGATTLISFTRSANGALATGWPSKSTPLSNTHNWQEDMADQILDLNPCRWKVFQCLLIGGENCGEDSLRHAETFVVTDEQFRSFLDRHSRVECLVRRVTRKCATATSYWMSGCASSMHAARKEPPSRSILDVGGRQRHLFQRLRRGDVSQARRSIPVEQERTTSWKW